MNIAMEQTEEFVDGQLKAKYGDCFIRGNNGKFLSLQFLPSVRVENVFTIIIDRLAMQSSTLLVKSESKCVSLK